MMHASPVRSTSLRRRAIVPNQQLIAHAPVGGSSQPCSLRSSQGSSSSHLRLVKQRRTTHQLRAKQDDEVEPNKAVLDAFFMGRAFAEVVNERVGTALGEVLSEVAKRDAENRRSLRDFQSDVTKRASIAQQRSLERKAAAAAASSTTSTQDKETASSDIPENSKEVDSDEIVIE